jgi:cell wall-associated NlpC family hydrolase
VITPALDPAEAVTAALPASPTHPESARISSIDALQERSAVDQRVSRGILRPPSVRPEGVRTPRRPMYLAARTARIVQRGAVREKVINHPVADQQAMAEANRARRTTQNRGAARSRHVARTGRPAVTHLRRVVTRHAPTTHTKRVVRVGSSGMNAVIAYARSQVGRRYVTGGVGGRGGFDCSGLTMRAYARAGLQLPHSSRAQAARARTISRTQARAGDLVVGVGHVGIYMGNGMMVDAGNPRVGVVYRKLYSGLRVKRF